MSESTPDPKLAELEKSLSALVPVPGRIDRDQLLFRAGQASARPFVWLWPTTTGLLVVVATVLGAALALRPVPIPVGKVVYVTIPQSAADFAPMPQVDSSASSRRPGSAAELDDDLWAGSAEYLRQRNQAIRWGVDALPASPSMASASRLPTLEGMLGLPEKKPEHLGLFPLKF